MLENTDHDMQAIINYWFKFKFSFWCSISSKCTCKLDCCCHTRFLESISYLPSIHVCLLYSHLTSFAISSNFILVQYKAQVHFPSKEFFLVTLEEPFQSSTLILFLLIVKADYTEKERSSENVIHWLNPQVASMAGASSGLPRACRVPKPWTILNYNPRPQANSWKWSSQDINWDPYGIPVQGRQAISC